MAILGTALGRLIFGKDAFGQKPKVPEVSKINVRELQKQTALDNTAALDSANTLATQYNLFNADQTKALSERLFPGLLKQATANTAANLRGELSPELRSQVRNEAAATSLGLGLGGSQFQVGLTGGRFLKTAEQLQQQGLQNFQTLQGMAPKPFDMSTMFFSAPQRYAMQYQENADQWNRNWLKAQVKASPDPFAHAMTQAMIKDEETIAEMATSYLKMMGG